MKMPGKKSRQILRLSLENEALITQLSKLRESVIRISVPTDLGVRPIYDCTIEWAIMQNLFAGGNGLTSAGPGEWINGPVIVELCSTWRPDWKDYNANNEG